MLLRPFQVSDLAAMYAVDQLCFRKGIAWPKAQLHSYARDPAVLTFVAEEEEQLCGFAMAMIRTVRARRSGNILTLDVHPDWRRRGVGRLLMAVTEEWLRTQQVGSCTLEVAVDDAGALSFYQQLSYVISGKRTGYYLGTLDAHVLRKTFVEGKIESDSVGNRTALLHP